MNGSIIGEPYQYRHMKRRDNDYRNGLEMQLPGKNNTGMTKGEISVCGERGHAEQKVGARKDDLFDQRGHPRSATRPTGPRQTRTRQKDATNWTVIDGKVERKESIHNRWVGVRVNTNPKAERRRTEYRQSMWTEFVGIVNGGAFQNYLNPMVGFF